MVGGLVGDVDGTAGDAAGGSVEGGPVVGCLELSRGVSVVVVRRDWGRKVWEVKEGTMEGEDVPYPSPEARSGVL